MTVHLIKLSVGPDSLAELAGWQAQRLKDMRRKGQEPELVHITRHRPKRAEEVLDGGSIYWVIKGWVVARQRLIALRPVTQDGIPHCGLVYAPELITVHPQPRRPFQGWRYLDAADAPSDAGPWNAAQGEADVLRRELMGLGLA